MICLFIEFLLSVDVIISCREYKVIIVSLEYIILILEEKNGNLSKFRDKML